MERVTVMLATRTIINWTSVLLKPSTWHLQTRRISELLKKWWLPTAPSSGQQNMSFRFFEATPWQGQTSFIILKQMIMTLMRLRLNLYIYSRSCFLFKVHKSTISSTCSENISTIYFCLRPLIYWPDRWPWTLEGTAPSVQLLLNVLKYFQKTPPSN